MGITRYARRMVIENALSDAVRFFHMNALSSTVGIKVDFDMALLVIASGLYHLLARKMRGYADAHADRDLPRPHRHACHGHRRGRPGHGPVSPVLATLRIRAGPVAGVVERRQARRCRGWFDKELAVAQELAAADPSNTQWQCDLVGRQWAGTGGRTSGIAAAPRAWSVHAPSALGALGPATRARDHWRRRGHPSSLVTGSAESIQVSNPAVFLPP